MIKIKEWLKDYWEYYLKWDLPYLIFGIILIIIINLIGAKFASNYKFIWGFN